jgi:hypothetical protein
MRPADTVSPSRLAAGFSTRAAARIARQTEEGLAFPAAPTRVGGIVPAPEGAPRAHIHAGAGRLLRRLTP